MIKVCQDCNKEFKIIPQEEEFYDKVEIDLPVSCPACRQQRRLKFKNSRNLNKRTCSKCGKDIITTYAAEFSHPVYCSTCFEESFN